MMMGLLGADVSSAVAASTNTAWNPSDKSAPITLSGANNLVATAGSTADQGVRAISAKTSGLYYVEYTIAGGSGGFDNGVGISLSSASLTTLGTNSTGAFMVFRAGAIWFNGAVAPGSPNIGSNAAGDTICMAVDFGNKRGWLRKNAGSWNASGTANPATNVGGVDISALFPGVGAKPCSAFNTTGASITANFGDSAFTQSVPSGFTAGWPS